ncbi:glycosyltransferase family 4 protein [Thiolapillus brandeum]|uniref:Glycosyl transferase family 1 n=1 Tax=Thiolapillus brandeum TaxID=1076588 RepID=A0A7U6JLE2_9GAMM|nr:glycosyltransferase family 4 protein [Thiolapillus brandeum]BAO45700.1 glycosyl transferase family 1 [Thiolapillus brandeum]
MKLAFVLFKYFPYGGLQRDMLQIARQCRARGHDIHIFTLSWEGPRPAGMHIHVLPVERLSNHRRYQEFCENLPSRYREYGIDRVIGFNKMPGLDFYYAADPCLKDKLVRERSALTRRLPRYRHFLRYEQAVFGQDSDTRILLISPRQHYIYQKHYATPDSRLYMLPPGIDQSRMAGPDAPELRRSLRQEFGIADDEKLILCIGSGFKTKGLDRSLKALAGLPDRLRNQTRLIAIGSDHGAPFVRLASRLGVGERFLVLHGRDDIPRFLQGGDLLLHPAYNENSGMVILEAIIAGLPLLVTSVCGYAYYAEEAQAGLVVPEPFEQQVLNTMLAEMLESPRAAEWRQNGIAYGQTHDLYSMTTHAADLILAP